MAILDDATVEWIRRKVNPEIARLEREAERSRRCLQLAMQARWDRERPSVTRPVLFRWYVEENLTLKEIGRRLDRSKTTIRYYFARFRIETRTITVQRRTRCRLCRRKNFVGRKGLGRSYPLCRQHLRERNRREYRAMRTRLSRGTESRTPANDGRRRTNAAW